MTSCKIPFWKAAFERHGGDLHQMLMYRLSWSDDAGDRLQDAFLNAMELFPEPPDQQSARAWLFSWVDVQLKNWALSRQVILSQAGANPGEILPDPPPFKHTEDSVAIFSDSVKALRRKYRQPIWFDAAVEGWDYEAMADEYGESEAAVRTKVYAARCDLLVNLAHIYPAEPMRAPGEHAKWETLISAMIDGDCDFPEVRALHEHFKTCQSCFIYYRNARLLDFRLAECREPDLESRAPDSLWRHILLESGWLHLSRGQHKPEGDPDTWSFEDRIAFLTPEERIARYVVTPLEVELVAFRWQSAGAGETILNQDHWDDAFFDRHLKRKGYASTGLYLSTNPHDSSPYGTAGGIDSSPSLLQFTLPAGIGWVDFFDPTTRENMARHNISPHQVRHSKVPMLLRFDHHDFNQNLGWIVLNHNPKKQVRVTHMDPTRYAPMKLLEMEHALRHNMATFPYRGIYTRCDKPLGLYHSIIRPHVLDYLRREPAALTQFASPKAGHAMKNYQWQGLKHPYLSYWGGERFVDYPDLGGRRLLMEFWAELDPSQRESIANAFLEDSTDPTQADQRKQLLAKYLEAAQLRPSERDNPHTQRLDELDTASMIGRIGDAEQELFGDGAGSGLLDQEFLQVLNSLKHEIQRVLNHPKGVIVIGGAGTSGRLAVHTQATHPSPKILASLAGGLAALFAARERVEDLPEQGVADLRKLVPEGAPFIYIGVTCGLSAAYVAGGVDWSLNHGEATAVIGFNPQHFASKRMLSIGSSTASFCDILVKLQQHPKGFLLNPAIGPEPITGSTRMKGGTATRLILDALLYECDTEAYLSYAADWQDCFYRDTTGLVPMVDAAARALANDGSIVYVTGTREGLMGLLDASECPPTFGADPDCVTALVPDNFDEILSGFDFKSFRQESFDPAAHKNSILFAVHHQTQGDTPPIAQAKKAGIPVFNITTPEPDIDRLKSPELSAAYRDLWLKWRLNLISTCAFVRAGKVHGNRMIDLKISNLKLFDRATRIIADLTNNPEAESVLRRVITADTDLDPNLPPEQLIPIAVQGRRIVPVAVLTARHHISIDEAKARLDEEPRLSFHLQKEPNDG